MMKTLGLVLVLLLVIGSAAMAQTTQTVTIDTYANWNLISMPLVPIDPVVADVFSNPSIAPIDPGSVNLLRWDAPTAGMIAYDPFNTPGDFGNFLLGDGYWLQYPTAGQIVYTGVPDGVPDINGNKTDMWISLPGIGRGTGGWNLIGQPFDHDTAVDPNADGSGSGIFFTDGTTVKDWGDAANAGWVDSAMPYWDGTHQGMNTMGYSFNDDDHLRAGHGYWLLTHKDNLALIIPSTPS